MQCLQVEIVRGLNSDQKQRILLRAGSLLRIGRDASNEFVVDLNGVSGVHAELALRAAVEGADPNQAPELCICDRSKNGTAIRAGPRVPGSGWTAGKASPSWERLASGTSRTLPHGWQVLVPAKSRKGDQQTPMVQRLLTVFTQTVDELAELPDSAPADSAAPEAVGIAEPNAVQDPLPDMDAEETPVIPAIVAEAEAQRRQEMEEKERKRRERKEKRKAEKRAALAALGQTAAATPAAALAPASAPLAPAGIPPVARFPTTNLSTPAPGMQPAPGPGMQKRERKRRRAEMEQSAAAAVSTPAGPAPVGTPPPVPEDRRLAQVGALEEEIARQEAERAKAAVATTEDGVAEEVARTARPKRKARTPGQPPTATPGAGGGDEDSEQTDVPEGVELSDAEAPPAVRKAGAINGTTLADASQELPPEEPGMPPPLPRVENIPAGASSTTAGAPAAVSEAALAEEKVRAAAAAAAMRKAAARAAAKEGSTVAGAGPAKERRAKEPRTKVRRRPEMSPEAIRSDSEAPAPPVSAVPLTAAAVSTLPTDIPLFELRSVSPISQPGISPKKRRRKAAGPGDSEIPERRARKPRRERPEAAGKLAAAAGRRRVLPHWRDTAGQADDSELEAAPELENLPDRWAPSPSPAIGAAASKTARAAAAAAALSGRAPGAAGAVPGTKLRSRSRRKLAKRGRSDDEKKGEKVRARSRDRRRQRELAAAAALAGDPVGVRRTRR